MIRQNLACDSAEISQTPVCRGQFLFTLPGKLLYYPPKQRSTNLESGFLPHRKWSAGEENCCHSRLLTRKRLQQVSYDRGLFVLLGGCGNPLASLGEMSHILMVCKLR